MSANPMKPCQYTDEQWVDLLQAETKAATPQEKKRFEPVINCLWEELFTYCVNRAARYGQGEHFAQDAAEDAYFRIRRAVDKGQYLAKSPFLWWCRKIATNCINTLLRLELKRRGREDSLPSEGEDE
jgi:DNA-directed RNA polymerase specialized sigma24 family protein